MAEIDLGLLTAGPHAALIRRLAERCYADSRVQAMWVGGSLASGHGDAYSDVDFRIAVEPGQIEAWLTPDWERYLPIPSAGGQLLRFGEQALLHHLIMADGTILDFYVQDTSQRNPEPQIVIIACRDAEFRAQLEGFAQPAASLLRPVDGTVMRQFFIEYWITTHKQMKAIARNYNYTMFAGLNLERMALLRAWHLLYVGSDIDSRPTLHMIGLMHKGLRGKLSVEQQRILGLPSQTFGELATVVEAIRAEMASAGHALAEQHGFDYPYELEAVVQKVWGEHKHALLGG